MNPADTSNRERRTLAAWMVAAAIGMSFFLAIHARVFPKAAILLNHFSHSIDGLRLVATFAEIRQEMTTLDRWVYSALDDLLERGWGYWAVALHSIVLGAFWTLVIYGLYRLNRGAVQQRRTTEGAAHGEAA